MIYSDQYRFRGTIPLLEHVRIILLSFKKVSLQGPIMANYIFDLVYEIGTRL